MNKVSYYIRDDYIKKNGESAIYIVTYINKRKVLVPTGVDCKLSEFDKLKGEIRGISKRVKDKNLLLKSSMSRFNEILFRYRLQYKNLTPAIIKKEFDNPTSYTSFIDYMQKEIENRKGILAESTIKQQKSALNKLKKFKKDVSFADFNGRFVEDFKKHLRNVCKNSPNTIEANIKDLKIYMAKAEADKLIDQNVFKNYRAKRVKTSFTYLDKDELKKLYGIYQKHTFDKSGQAILRHFLFQCFTGLRFSDIKQITHEMISNNKLYFIPHKTKNSKRETLIVPLIGLARKLIRDENPYLVYGNVFKTFAEQVANRSLKKIMSAAEIDKHVTTHVGRHTFATLYYEETSDVASLQKLLGHSRITETMVYAHVSEAKKDQQMRVFENSLVL